MLIGCLLIEWCENGHFFPGLSTPNEFVDVAVPLRYALMHRNLGSPKQL